MKCIIALLALAAVGCSSGPLPGGDDVASDLALVSNSDGAADLSGVGRDGAADLSRVGRDGAADLSGAGRDGAPDLSGLGAGTVPCGESSCAVASGLLCCEAVVTTCQPTPCPQGTFVTFACDGPED